MKPSQLTAYLKWSMAINEPILVTGAPGIGKTDVITDYSASEGRALLVSHPVIADPTDYKGLPFADVGNGTAAFLPYGDLREMISADKPTDVFFDDMGQAPPLVQAALMQLVLARKIGGHAVSPFVRFLAATNRRQDNAAVSRILEPLKGRFNIIGLEIDVRDWQRWAGAKGLPIECIAFTQWKPELIEQFAPTPEIENTPTPRTYAATARKVALGGLPADIELEAYAGDIGKAAAGELVAFLRSFRNLTNPQAAIMAPDTADIPPVDKPDARFQMCAALVRLATENNIGNVIKYTARMGDPFAVFTVSQVIVREKALRDAGKGTSNIQHTGAFIQWAADKGDLLS